MNAQRETVNERVMTGEGEALRTTAVRALQTLGLSEYAARTLVALTRIGGGSARDVSETSSVPRTRVYDAVDELSNRGFVRVQESHPQVFEPVDPECVRRAFFREYVLRQVVAEWGLRALQPPASGAGSDAIDVAAGVDEVRALILATIANVSERLTYVTVAGVPDEDVLAALDDAVTRGVTVRVVCAGDADAGSVRDSLPGATVFDVPSGTASPNDRYRLLLVDESVALVGTRFAVEEPSPEIGVLATRTSPDVTALLRQVVDAWVADAR